MVNGDDAFGLRMHAPRHCDHSRAVPGSHSAHFNKCHTTGVAVPRINSTEPPLVAIAVAGR